MRLAHNVESEAVLLDKIQTKKAFISKNVSNQIKR